MSCYTTRASRRRAGPSLALHFKEGMTLPEVAAVLDVPLGTVKSRLAYGLATLRRHHAQGEDDE